MMDLTSDVEPKRLTELRFESETHECELKPSELAHEGNIFEISDRSTALTKTRNSNRNSDKAQKN